MTFNNRWKSRMLGLVLAAIATTPLRAGTFSVSPVRIEISLKRPYMNFQVLNQSDESTLIQVHVVKWDVRDNQDVYAQTDEFLLNPPIFTLGPQQKQFIRLGLLKPLSEAGENTYRLILEEVPRPLPTGSTGLRTVLRISIPIFYNAGKATQPQVSWQVDITTQGLQIKAFNQGSVHVQIKSLEIVPDATEGTPLRITRSEYILPGQYRTWLIHDERIKAAVRLKLVAVTDSGEFHAVLEPKAP
jgi:fimbrial chaperone protein